ncbi:aspartyl-phosphate phosphatase Spo0E family protein [Chengkuizengella axinellae]|uniref:Aspartyl-phosphate phosphatase Spo0E family protein n=1 Tax=Chengkuizengella axinellae TaxID=3064388 RepID=A0ABT9IZ00_9BACL|nr:aspartyl-phosphate phosphatase Spo0E family protein [Chengkuizengella sp. 2205SS18-9]MDP5274582.1 aspartyl-phosphate phosphatase Spo0E family protein [Chengkuizengella sp. 2205SS18-9]
MQEKQLNKKIEELRHQLTVLIKNKEDFVDDHVLAVSQQLDNFIIQLQMMKQIKKSIPNKHQSA